MSTTKRFLAFSCVHVPHHLPEAWESMRRLAAYHNPDVLICLGDLLNATAASRWAHEEEHTLLQECKQANGMIEGLRKSCGPNVQCIWTLGNHDDNLLAPNRIPKDLRDAVDFRRHMSEVCDKHWKILPYLYHPPSVFRIGQVSFFHGFEHGATAGANQAITLGRDWPYALSVWGHTHRPYPVERVKVRANTFLNRYTCNTGTLCDPSKMQYISRKNASMWGAGVCIGTAEDLRSPRESKCWDAELITSHGYWEAA